MQWYECCSSQSTEATVIVDVLKYADVMASTRPSLWLSVPGRSHEEMYLPDAHVALPVMCRL
jgi:hypothetical protein